MNEKLVSVLLQGKIRCPHMAALGYPKIPDTLPCICEIPNTRARFISTTRQECHCGHTCLVFQTLPLEASTEANMYDQQRS